MARILIVEDEPDIALGLQLDLTDEGHDVEFALDGEEAGRRAKEPGWDLIVLDVMLPLKDGFEVCRGLRRAKIRTPLLMLTAKTQEAEKTIQDALRLVATTSNRQWHLEVGIAAARVEAATGKRAAAATRLRKIRDDAKGFMAVELDAEMTLGEVEIASGQVAEGRARLESVERQARSKNLLLIANQAAAARR